MSRVLTALLACWLVLPSARPARADARDGKPAAAPPAAGEDPLAIPPMFESLFPARVKRLKEIAVSHPQLYRSAVQKMREVAAELELVKHSDLEEYNRRVRALRLESEVETLTVRWRATKDAAEKARLEQALRAKLAQLLDLKDEHLQHSIAVQEAELERLKSRLDKRKAARQTLIDKRLRELKDQDDELDF